MNNGIKDQTVTMAHGAGGRQTSELIDNIFAAHFANPDLTADDVKSASWENGSVYRWIYRITCIFPRRKYRKTVYLRNSQ